MSTATEIATRKFLRWARDNGVKVWISYGQTEIEGWVLDVAKHTVDVQDADCGHIQTVALVAIDEMVEAA